MLERTMVTFRVGCTSFSSIQAVQHRHDNSNTQVQDCLVVQSSSSLEPFRSVVAADLAQRCALVFPSLRGNVGACRRLISLIWDTSVA